MPHTRKNLEWNVEGTQDFTARLSADLDGATIDTITSIKLQKRIGTNPEIWEDTATVAASSSIVADDVDPDNPLASSAVYWTAAADVDGDPLPGLTYRWLVLVVDNNSLDVVAKIPVDLPA